MLTKKFKHKKFDTILQLLTLYPKKEFKSPYRSTIPLICFIENYRYFEKELFEPNEIIEFIYEFETPVKKGKGLPSCSDLLIKLEDKSIIIEAKRTEPKYKKVSEWNYGTKNKELVLSGWLEYIKEYINIEISVDDIQNIPYQMIHRIASACSLKSSNIEVIYLGFDLDKEMKSYYKSNLSIISLLTKSKIKMSLLGFDIIKSDDQINLEDQWDKGERDLSKEIIKGIINNSLMSFKKSEEENGYCI